MRAKLMWSTTALVVFAAVGVGAMAGEPPLVRAARDGNTAQVRTFLKGY